MEKVQSIVARAMPVGVLGCTGDLGSNFAKYGLSKGLKLYAQVRMDSVAKALTRIHQGFPNARWIYGDIFDTRLIESMFSCCGAVFSFAGMCGLGFTKESYVEVLSVNGFFHGVVGRLLGEIDRREVLYVYPSTERVYRIMQRRDIRRWVEKAIHQFEDALDTILAKRGLRDAVADFVWMFIRENGIPENANVYEISKLLGEGFVFRLPKYSNLRISSVYGNGCWPRGKIQRIIYSFMRGGVREETRDRRDYIYVGDLCKILFEIYRLDEPRRKFLRNMDVASGEIVDLAEAVSKIQSYMPASQGTVLFGSRDYSGTVATSGFAKRLLRRQFTRFDVGIKKTVDYYLQNFEKGEESVYLEYCRRSKNTEKLTVERSPAGQTENSEVLSI